MDDYSVERIPANPYVAPACGEGERRHKRENPPRKEKRRDSVEISEEAKRRSAREEEVEVSFP